MMMMILQRVEVVVAEMMKHLLCLFLIREVISTLFHRHHYCFHRLLEVEEVVRVHHIWYGRVGISMESSWYCIVIVRLGSTQ